MNYVQSVHDVKTTILNYEYCGSQQEIKILRGDLIPTTEVLAYSEKGKIPLENLYYQKKNGCQIPIMERKNTDLWVWHKKLSQWIIVRIVGQIMENGLQ